MCFLFRSMECGCLQSQFGNSILLKSERWISPKFDLLKWNTHQGPILLDSLKHSCSGLAIQLIKSLDSVPVSGYWMLSSSKCRFSSLVFLKREEAISCPW